jgi:hypothetical protein
MLIWGIEAGQKFSGYPYDFQYRIQPLLKPEEIALMEVDIKELNGFTAAGSKRCPVPLYRYSE